MIAAILSRRPIKRFPVFIFCSLSYYAYLRGENNRIEKLKISSIKQDY